VVALALPVVHRERRPAALALLQVLLLPLRGVALHRPVVHRPQRARSVLPALRTPLWNW
jgi:hypothetical protein